MKFKKVKSEELLEMIRTRLKSLGAPLITVHSCSAKFTSTGVIVDTLEVSLGECTGEELEAIKQMRDEFSEYDIQIINVLVHL